MRIITTILCLSLLAFSCSHSKQNSYQGKEVQQLQTEVDSLNHLLANNTRETHGQIATFLTFQKEDAEQAMNFYISLFDNSKVISLKRWEKGGQGKEGTIMHATFNLNGQQFMCSDSPPIHDWDFTPAVSNFVECSTESELDQLFTRLSEKGQVLMPLNNYGFSQKFGFVIDQFGVSWQLNYQ